MFSKFFRPKTAAMLLGILVVSAMIFGFAATNTVNTSYVGSGDGTVSGDSGVAVVWDFTGGADTNPTDIEIVTLTFTDMNPLNEVIIDVDAGGGYVGTYTTVCALAANVATCTFGVKPATASVVGIRVTSR